VDRIPARAVAQSGSKKDVIRKPEYFEVVPPHISQELKKRWSYSIRKVYETDPLVCASARVSTSGRRFSFMVSTYYNYAVPVLGLLFLSSCATLNVAQDVPSGRKALQLGQPKAAMTHFEDAARSDPNYLTDFALIDIGISSYIGMAYYQAGGEGKGARKLQESETASQR